MKSEWPLLAQFGRILSQVYEEAAEFWTPSPAPIRSHLSRLGRRWITDSVLFAQTIGSRGIPVRFLHVFP
jgi:hypothetical protein